MKIPIFLLLTLRAILGQDAQSGYQQYPQETQRRSSTSYATSIVHGDKEGRSNAQSTIKVNLKSGLGTLQHIQSQPHKQQSYNKPGITYSQPDPIHVVEPQHNQGNIQYKEKQHFQQLPAELKYQGLKQSGEDNTALYFQRLQPQGGHETILQYHGPAQTPSQATKYLQVAEPKNVYQFSSLQPQSTHQTPTIIQKDSKPQLYNVGYSINIENSAPKLMYRVPNPQGAQSYRQQKLLNGDVITGSHKDVVAKPSGLAHVSYEAKSGGIANFQLPANYIAIEQKQPGAQHGPVYDQHDKPQATKVYSDIRNTHGYTWKNLSPGVEISGYHSLDKSLSNNQQDHSHTFDHAAALGRSQEFDISNVVQNGNRQYQSVSGEASSETQSSRISKTIAAPVPSHSYEQQSSNGNSGSNQDIDYTKFLEAADSKFQQQSTGSLEHSQNVEIPKLAVARKPQYLPVTSALKSSQLGHSVDNAHSTFKFPFIQSSGTEFLNFHGSPFRQNSGSNVEFDKSLFDNFYKNYKPAFYSPEVTLPSPHLPGSISPGIHFGATQQNSIQLPSFDYKYGAQSAKFPGLNNQFQVDPQLLINQHYAFAQAAEGLASPQPQAVNLVPGPNRDVKPVQESQEDHQGAHSEQLPTMEEVDPQQVAEPIEKPLLSAHTSVTTSSGHKLHYYPPGNAILPRPYGPRALMYVPEKTFRLKTNLRPPPMIVIHQKYTK